EVAEPHGGGGEPGQENGGSQMVHGCFLGRNLGRDAFAPRPGSALRLKCWVGRGRLPEALRRATRQGLIVARRATCRGNGRCKTQAPRPPGAEKAPFPRGAARARRG